MKQLSHLLQRISPNLAVILLGLFFILGTDGDYPIITILDDNPAIIKLGDVYTDAGATAEDKQDGKIDVITTGLDAIDTSVAKNYTVTYTATDSDKNITIATRLVKVIEKTVIIEAPKNLNASAGDQQITLTWDVVTAADKYTLYSAEETGITPENYSVYKGGTMLDNKTSPFVLTGLENGKTYYFVVTASYKEEAEESKASNEVSATPKKVVIVQPLGKLNDTGITLCANDSSNDLDCPIAGYPGQDAEFGSNAMNFSKLGDNGEKLSDNATKWSCVNDNVTGLIWEVKTTSGLHNNSDTYNWYSTDVSINGGFSGDSNDHGDVCFGYNVNNDTTYCNTKAYIDRVNKERLCDIANWRLPTYKELHSIVSYNRKNPAINTTYFPNTVSYLYWTSSISTHSAARAWDISFYYGSSSYLHSKNRNSYVRLVHAD